MNKHNTLTQKEAKNVAIPVESHPFTALANAQYINLTTFRKSGVAVATPVWFAEHAGRLYVEATPSTGKVKRVRHTARVTVAPCTGIGKVTDEVETCRQLSSFYSLYPQYCSSSF